MRPPKQPPPGGILWEKLGVPSDLSDLRVARAWPACWGPGGEWKLLVSLPEGLPGRLRGPGLAVRSRLRSWRGFLTFGRLCHRSQSGCAWSRQELPPARICELSMEPFECEHKTPVSQGLGEGTGTEASLVATPFACQRLPGAGQAAAVQTDGQTQLPECITR